MLQLIADPSGLEPSAGDEYFLGHKNHKHNIFDYDWVIVTRFDMIWRMPLQVFNISSDHVNVVTELDDGKTIDDNLYIFNAKVYLEKMLGFWRSNPRQY